MTTPIEWYSKMLENIEASEDDPENTVFVSLTQKECLIYNLGLKLVDNMFCLDIDDILSKMADCIREQKGDESIVKEDDE